MADRPGPVGAGLIGGNDRCRLRDAVALQQLDIVFAFDELARLVAQAFGAADRESQAGKITVRGRRIYCEMNVSVARRMVRGDRGCAHNLVRLARRGMQHRGDAEKERA
jgi:hypothetical protein